MKKVTPCCNTGDILGLLYVEEVIILFTLGIGNGSWISQWRSVENFLRKTN